MRKKQKAQGILCCRKCRKQISNQATYCPYCGANNASTRAKSKRHLTDAANQPSMKKRFSRRWWGICIIASILVIIAFLLITICNQNRVILTTQEAQAKMDSALEDVFREASSDNYIAQSLKEKVRITVDSLESTGDGYFAECTVTSVDITTPLLDYLLGLNDGAIDAYSNVVEGIRKEIAGAEEIQQTFYVEFTQVNGGYKATLSEEMVVFCSGNVQELLPKLYEILQGGTME